MRVSGVICEFNPFHNGHAYLLSRMREQVGEDGLRPLWRAGRIWWWSFPSPGPARGRSISPWRVCGS